MQRFVVWSQIPSHTPTAQSRMRVLDTPGHLRSLIENRTMPRVANQCYHRGVTVEPVTLGEEIPILIALPCADMGLVPTLAGLFIGDVAQWHAPVIAVWVPESERFLGLI